VELGKRLGFGARAGFLNAVLRGYARERDQTRLLLEELKQSDPALGYSHPEWLVQRWEERWGREQTLKLLQWNNSPAPIFARLNRLKTDFSGLEDRWRKEGVEFEERNVDWVEPGVAFELRSHPPLAESESFQDGFFYVQDPSTLLAVEQLSPQSGETILDLCAAPGGKTTFIAQLMRNSGRIVACDAQPGRLHLVQENCARLGVTCVETANAPDAAMQFDRILVDAPCSNTGVLRRRVDLRWRLQAAEIVRLRKAQLALLAQAAPRLKAGGVLVYSTCSMEPEENQEVAKEFLDAHPQFKMEAERQLLPFTDNVDGAYVARFKKQITQ
ncbi:MAG TPA: 16S rRNA (cytosine(967)-C(5))-methyltransferase RsmB, partial [Verrucomicrobiae bacterium]|nr:16S rRNA (cytosine(967)-C(5))-methyltransferase RsmB [Verrucomicrobiae bacterium]